MKAYVLISLLITMFFTTAVFSQESYEESRPPEEEEWFSYDPDEHARSPEEEMEREVRIQNMHLELQEREADLDFRRKMKALELEKRKIALEHERKPQRRPARFKHCPKEKMLPFLIVCFVVHILLAVWVYKDIRARNSGSGIWIVIVLLTGLLGVLPYAIVRLGDIRQAKS